MFWRSDDLDISIFWQVVAFLLSLLQEYHCICANVNVT